MNEILIKSYNFNKTKTAPQGNNLSALLTGSQLTKLSELPSSLSLVTCVIDSQAPPTVSIWFMHTHWKSAASMFCTYYNGSEFLLKLYLTAIYGVMFQLADTINFDDGSAFHISSSVVSFFLYYRVWIYDCVSTSKHLYLYKAFRWCLQECWPSAPNVCFPDTRVYITLLLYNCHLN